MRKKRTSRSKYAILGFLASKPRSGYDIKKAIEKSISFFWNESYGQIYPILKALVSEGLAEKLVEDEKSARGKQKYAITELGQEHLQNWIKQAADYGGFRNEVLLKLYFGDHSDVASSINHLNNFIDHHKMLHETFLGFKSTLPSIEGKPVGPLTYMLATLQYGILATKFNVDWAKDTIRLLEGKKTRMLK